MRRCLGGFSVTAGVLGLLVVGLLLVPASRVAAHESPVGCAGNGIGATFSRSPTGAVIHGNTITYTILISNAADGCDITGLKASITLPSGSVITVATNASLPQGDSFQCPNAAEPRCVTAGPYSYTVAHADEKAITSGPGQCPPTFGPGSAVTAIYLSSGTLHDNAIQDDPTGDCKSITNNVEHPNLSVQKASTTPTISAGEQATYTITVTNNGPGDAANVTLTDTVPNSVAAPGWTVGGANAASCAPNPVAGGALLTCNFGTVAAGQSRTITLTATTTPANCPVINNSAHVAASNEAAAQQGNNDVGPVPINVNCPSPTLSILKNPKNGTYNLGDPVTFTIVVTNNGPGTATSVTLDDLLPGSPADLNWDVSQQPAQGSCV